MKYFSEKTRHTYDTEEECLKAEKEWQDAITAEREKKNKIAEERKARAKEVEDAFKAILEAQKHYNDVKNSFLKDYGSFHMTLRTGEGNPFDLFDALFDKFW